MNVSELETILAQAVRSVASKLGVANAEFYSVGELRERVGQTDSRISDKLEAFINAYFDWFNYQKRNDDLGKSGNLDPDDAKQLECVINRRNAIRKELLVALGEEHCFAEPKQNLELAPNTR